jgi:hypothetical protein
MLPPRELGEVVTPGIAADVAADAAVADTAAADTAAADTAAAVSSPVAAPEGGTL